MSDDATAVQGVPNRLERTVTPTHSITIGGRTKSIREWAVLSGVPADLICGRINVGWDAERAVNTPDGQTQPPPIQAAKATVAPRPVSIVGAFVVEEPIKAEGGEGSDGKPLPKVKMIAYTGGPIRVGYYGNPVVIDLQGLKGVGKDIPLYRQHDSDRIVGHGQAKHDNRVLNVEGILSAENDECEEIVTLAKNGFPWQASVGVNPTRFEYLEAEGTVTVNGQVIKGPVTIVREGELYEVSVVPVGADGKSATKIAAQKSVPTGEKSMKTFAEWLAEGGFVEAELSDVQRKRLEAAYKAEMNIQAAGGAGGNNGQGAGGNNGSGNGNASAGEGTATPNIVASSTAADMALQALRAKELRLEARVQLLCKAINAGMNSQTAETLRAAGDEKDMDAAQFELEILRLSRFSNGQHVAYSRPARESSALVIEASLMRTMNPEGLEKMYSPEILAESEKAYRNGLTLIECLRIAARRQGYNEVSHRNLRPLLQAAFAPVHAAASGPSTYDVSGLLSNVANKMIRNGFDNVEQEWRKVAAVGSVTDFKEMPSYSLTGDFVYQKVGPGGEIKHANMGETKYSNRAETYARMFAITRQDLINDDLGAFTRVRNLLGRGAALSLNQVFWAEFLANVNTFYSAANKNLLTGATSALDIDSLSRAEQLFLDQTDPDGNPMGVMPTVLVVPTALKVQGTRLVNDPTLMISGNTDRIQTSANPHAGKFVLCCSTYLNNAKIPNGSASHWFLTADPNDVPTIEVVFLNGQQAPIVESADLDFDALGIQLRGYSDFGVSKMEPRAAVRSTGV